MRKTRQLPAADDESGLQQTPELDPKPKPSGVTADAEAETPNESDGLAEARKLERLQLERARRAALDRGDGMLNGVYP